MTSRILSQCGTVIAADFSRADSRRGEITIEVSAETLYADNRTILMRCRIGNHVFHMLGDIASGKVISI